MNLATSLDQIKGVGPKTAAELRQAGLETVGDIFLFLPRKHEDFTHVTPIAELSPGKVTIRARCQQISTRPVRRGLRLTTAVLDDDTSKLNAVWFNQPYRVQQLGGSNEWFYFSGVFEYNYGRYQLTNPSAEAAKQLPVQADRLLPVYHAVRGLKTTVVRKVIEQLRPLMSVLPETLPPSVVQSEHLVSRAAAISAMHFPRSDAEVRQARERLAFEELFELVLASQLNKIDNQKLAGFAIPFEQSVVQDFVQNLPFALTNAQRRAAWDILQDFERAAPMNRLLQGDVGSGKTLVALMTMLLAIGNSYQACIMAPTEILAEQHLATLRGFLENMPLRVELLTGSVKGKRRQEILAALSSGEVDILVGTHAIIEEPVEFRRLGLAVVDEQHRFGVAQRAKLWSKSEKPPHILVMTATPIPRTLAMTIYGDLDVSVIDELPPGRKPVYTIHKYDSQMGSLYQGIRKQIAMGRQVYIVYPLIKESEKIDLKNLEEGYNHLMDVFPNYKMSKIHGKMKPKEKDAEMQRFARGETQILVATTVIEVGVNVPNASVMVILEAQRFGLSQLHQLRGRVGRGADQSYCILVTGNELAKETRMRIDIMCDTNDGFQIAEADLKLRGPGDLEGTQQSGLAFDLKIADIARDGQIVQMARDEAQKIIDVDPECNKTEYSMLWDRLRELRKTNINWAAIS